MKLIIILGTVFTAILLSGCSKTIDREKLQSRAGIYYEINETAPYSGMANLFHPNGQKAFEVSFVDGRKQGLETRWLDNGQKSSEINYVDGNKHGKQTVWHDNGRISYETNHVDGIKHGRTVSWNRDDGTKLWEISYVNGERERSPSLITDSSM